MITSKFLKYYVLCYLCLAYAFAGYYTEYITWHTPTHIRFIMNFVVVVGSVFMGGMVLSSLAEDMMARKESFTLFGDKKVWRTWQYAILPMLIWGVYKWDYFGIIIPSLLFYLGMKVLITNHNKHVDEYNKEMLVRKARQEDAEKIKL